MASIPVRKDLGQNLLIDNSVRDRIVSAASVGSGDIVIEVGPGKGALTIPLVARALFVLAIEIDPRFCGYLRERLSNVHNLEVLNADFLNVNLEEQVARLTERVPEARAVKIISNLPFYITTPIVTRIIESRSLIDQSVLTVQKEVGERFTASPGSKRYGAITLFLNYHADVRILFPVSRQAFRPMPEVDGAVISVVPRSQPPVSVRDEALLFRVIRTAFGQRRKMLRNSLMGLELPAATVQDALRNSGLDPKLRPEQVSITEFARLADSFSGMADKKIA